MIPDLATPAPVDEARIRAAFDEQALWCERMGSPFTAALCRLLGRTLDDGTAIGRRVLAWREAPEPAGSALALRLCGGLHFLAMRGADAELSATWPAPGNGGRGDLAALDGVVRRVLVEQADVLDGFLDSPPQTNEVGRSGPLVLGFLTIARLTGLPLALYELGASAGLNQVPDRLRVDLGGRTFGRKGALVHLTPEWRGPPPADLPDSFEVIARRGVDRAPLDITDDLVAKRLLAYVWPDQSERIARLKAALATARTHGVMVERGEAADWVEANLHPLLMLGYVRVLYHSVTAQYFDADTAARIAARMQAAGALTSPQAPLAHLQMEKADTDPERGMELRLTLWRGAGPERLLLARTHPHGAWIDTAAATLTPS